MDWELALDPYDPVWRCGRCGFVIGYAFGPDPTRRRLLTTLTASDPPCAREDLLIAFPAGWRITEGRARLTARAARRFAHLVRKARAGDRAAQDMLAGNLVALGRRLTGSHRASAPDLVTLRPAADLVIQCPACEAYLRA